MFWRPFRWPCIYLDATVKSEPLIQSLPNLVGISPLSCVPADCILEKFCQIFFSEFFGKILNPFSPVELSICHILGMIGPINVKQKEMSQLDATLTRVHLTFTFDLEL